MTIPVELTVSEKEFEQLKRKIIYDNKLDMELVVTGVIFSDSSVSIDKFLVKMRNQED